MTKRDFFRIIIKLFGLYALILTIFTYIPTNISYVAYQFEPIVLLWIFGVAALTVLIYTLLIRKTDLIIDFLKIDKGFDDERIEFGNFNSQKIMQLALILIGGFLIIDYLPQFLQYTYLAFKKEVSPSGLNQLEEFSFGKTKDYLDWAISGINLIIGYILLTNYNRITNWINKKEKNV
ncbi:hypothetical protein EV196_102134 [Mariniflexile fucanivorans]|uniref:Uncharacterized protein n=1 Tax=Mariniflexile fucanivorans TaxID=264023 RepID=A0A4R1RMS1_9FLAO|nr:hypothetical protein [Mariniflexile fucanivorans]TCL67578.1 hypothetical protein EV196_102134 [Mariniflexile fucanivorans]